MTVHFGYDKKQVLEGLRNHFFARPEIRILIILVNVFAIISAILFYFKYIQALSFLIFSVLWFLLWLTFRRLLPMSIYKRSHTFQDNFTLSLNEQEGILLQTERGKQAWRWNDFSSFKETLYFFHLYFDSRSFFLIPKDSFKDLLEIQEARKWMKNNIGKNHKKES